MVIHKNEFLQEPQIKTVYVEKPVEKTVFVEVEKVIKEFIQPDRPVVNRIIHCPEKTKEETPVYEEVEDY